VYEQFPDIADPSPSPAASKAFMDAIFPMVGEMVVQLFTRERIRQLTERLRIYRNARHAAGDKQAVTLANGAIVSLGEERDPASSRFLYALGYLSLMKCLETTANSAQQRAPSPDEMTG